MKEDNKYVLEMQGVNLSFFGVQILHDVELKVKRGEVHDEDPQRRIQGRLRNDHSGR